MLCPIGCIIFPLCVHIRPFGWNLQTWCPLTGRCSVVPEIREGCLEAELVCSPMAVGGGISSASLRLDPALSLAPSFLMLMFWGAEARCFVQRPRARTPPCEETQICHFSSNVTEVLGGLEDLASGCLVPGGGWLGDLTAWLAARVGPQASGGSRWPCVQHPVLCWASPMHPRPFVTLTLCPFVLAAWHPTRNRCPLSPVALCICSSVHASVASDSYCI